MSGRSSSNMRAPSFDTQQLRTRSVPKAASLRSEEPLPLTPRQITDNQNDIDDAIRALDRNLLRLSKHANDGHGDVKYKFEISRTGSHNHAHTSSGLRKRNSPRRDTASEKVPVTVLACAATAAGQPIISPRGVAQRNAIPQPPSNGNSVSICGDGGFAFRFPETKVAFGRGLALLDELWQQFEGMALGGVNATGPEAMIAALVVPVREEEGATIRTNGSASSGVDENASLSEGPEGLFNVSAGASLALGFGDETLIHMLETAWERCGPVSEVFLNADFLADDHLLAEAKTTTIDEFSSTKVRYFRFDGRPTKAALMHSRSRIVAALAASLQDQERVYV